MSFGIAHYPADVVHLKTQQMPDPMREEHAGNAGFQGRLPGEFGQPDPVHHIAQNPMRRSAHRGNRGPRRSHRRAPMLRLVHGLDEISKAAGKFGA
jgi:hypothetical protein